MRIVLFCYHPYSFGILKPLNDAALNRGEEVLWYVREAIADAFPWSHQDRWTSSIHEVTAYQPDALFVPGNEVPFYIRGVKVQVFHGLAGEKKGHFRVRNYFDLYLTQGPYFTEKFKALARKHLDFQVEETGWCKLDTLFELKNNSQDFKEELLERYKVKNILLYAPTFSPSLTSAEKLFDYWEQFLLRNKDFLVVVKFHDLMDSLWKGRYKELFAQYENALFVDDPDILKWLVVSDLMISDTSSVVYECLLLDKPVLTFGSAAGQILWQNSTSPESLEALIMDELTKDPFRAQRKQIISQYHPYTDGLSSKRMLEAVAAYISANGVPLFRKLNLYRRLKVKKMFGPCS